MIRSIEPTYRRARRATRVLDHEEMVRSLLPDVKNEDLPRALADIFIVWVALTNWVAYEMDVRREIDERLSMIKELKMSLDVYLETDPCDKCGSSGEQLYWRNITHNLNNMANAAGIYEPLWRPDEIGITKAGQLIEPLTAGLAKLVSERVEMQKHNPANGWGDYMALVNFVSSYLAACKASPNANVRVSR